MNKTIIFTALLSILSPTQAVASGACGNPAVTSVQTSAGQTKVVAKTAPASFGNIESSLLKTSSVAGFNPSDELKQASSNFKERYPKTKVKEFSLTPVPGIFEAAVAKEVIYFDKSARFLFSGRLLDMEKGLDLTDKRIRDIRRIDINRLPLENAIKEVKGNGRRKLVVFTDVDCPYSRKLAQTLEGLTDITVYTFLFPLTSIHPEAKAKSDAIWCSSDSVKELANVLKGSAIRTVKNNPICSSPVESILKLAAENGIAGTPTIFNEAGDRTAGALPADKLEEFINAGKGATPNA